MQQNIFIMYIEKNYIWKASIWTVTDLKQSFGENFPEEERSNDIPES